MSSFISGICKTLFILYPKFDLPLFTNPSNNLNFNRIGFKADILNNSSEFSFCPLFSTLTEPILSNNSS